MAKKNTEAQEPEVEAQVQETQEDVVDTQVEETASETNGIRCLVSQTKDGVTKVAETLDEGWTADGVALVDGDETLLVVDLNESQLAFGGDESQDLEEDVASPSMTGLDGEQRSAFLISFYEREEKAVPALTACAEYGWLPSGGEMALIFANKDAINAVLATLEGDALGDGKYWTSQRFSNDRIWSCDMNAGTFGIALGTASVAAVRAVKK